jgi:hypothetical protein
MGSVCVFCPLRFLSDSEAAKEAAAVFFFAGATADLFSFLLFLALSIQAPSVVYLYFCYLDF